MTFCCGGAGAVAGISNFGGDGYFGSDAAGGLNTGGYTLVNIYFDFFYRELWGRLHLYPALNKGVEIVEDLVWKERLV